MGSLFGDWPSYDPHNFSQLRPSDPSNPSRLAPATYHPTHSRTLPPPDQDAYGCCNLRQVSNRTIEAASLLSDDEAAFILLPISLGLEPLEASKSGTWVICTESKNILIRQFYKHAEEKLRPKRAASDNLVPENGAKHMRASTSGTL